jgi:hypothetical protein
MSGGQKATILLLLCAVGLVFWALFRMLQATTSTPEGTPSPVVLHTPTSTATATSPILPSQTSTRIVPPTHEPTLSATPTPSPTHSPSSTPVPPTATSTPSPTATSTQLPTPTPVPQPTVPAEVAQYLNRFVPVVVSVNNSGATSSSGPIDQSTADRLREAYRQLHSMPVPESAEDMHLDFIVYVSVLEEKCLCHIFAEAHAANAQGQHFRQCETYATNKATEILNRRFVPSRNAFLKTFSLTARDVGLPS